MQQVEQTLKVLGLKVCENTVVGNALLRGISGGERKRLTTAEMTGGSVLTRGMPNQQR
jgi:ABC-type multidrug transport system ATPase subunit